MKIIQSLVIGIAAITASSLFPMNKACKTQQNHESISVLSFDLDDVMSSKEKASMYGFALLGARAAFFNPSVLALITKLSAMQEQGKSMAANINGTSNLIHAMLLDLKNQGYGDLSYYEDEIIEGATNPKPIMRMVENVQRLKSKGFTILAATNQDYKQFLAYRKNMKNNHGVDLDQLFNAVLTTRVLHMTAPQTSEPFFVPQGGPANVYQLIDPRALKPSASYYHALTQLAQKITGHRRVTVIHTDDKNENTQGAREADLGFVEFTLAGENARKTKPEDVQKTIDTWEQTLKRRFGITVR